MRQSTDNQRSHSIDSRGSWAALALCAALPGVGCGLSLDDSSSQGIYLTVTWPNDGLTVGGRFMLIKSDCFDSGQHPCDTWSVDTSDLSSKQFFLNSLDDLPDESMYLRVESLLTNSCTDIQATSTTPMRPAVYLGGSFTVSLDAKSPQPGFQIEQQTLCPFSFDIAGLGTGIVTLTDADSKRSYSNQSEFPHEFPLNTRLIATALPTPDSVFSSWTAPQECALNGQPTCSFTFVPPGNLTVEFEVQ